MNHNSDPRGILIRFRQLGYGSSYAAPWHALRARGELDHRRDLAHKFDLFCCGITLKR
jgi:hypothetical protein